MEIEQLEIFDFLKTCYPLNKLNKEQLLELAKSIKISYFRRSQIILTPDTSNQFLYLIRSGAVERSDDSKNIVAKFESKDFFGHRSLERSGVIKKQVIAIEDSLFYMIPDSIYFKLMKLNTDFRRYFHQEKNKRLKLAVKEIHNQDKNNLQFIQVKSLLNRNCLRLSGDTSIKKTARLMTDHKSTSALIMENEVLLGIVTDRVFCTKIVATGMNPDNRIDSIMTPKPLTVNSQTSGLEAMLIMARNNIRHLPVVDDGKLSGLITATDLIHHQSHNPIYVVNQIHKSTEISELARISQSLPDTLCKLVETGFKAQDITYSISSIGRAITQRLIKLAIDFLGTPPVPFAFLVAGSLARNDQVLNSDQDNGILISDEYNAEEHQKYFKDLASFVSDGLNKCGYVYCPGNVMATNEKWCQPYSTWKNYFRNWIHNPEPKALMFSSIFFDMRCVYGDKTLLDRLNDEVMAMIQNQKLFISFMAANALQNRPPLGIFRRFILEKHGEEEKSLDIKKRGIMPCIDIARVFALDAGVSHINTRDRINYSCQSKVISKEAKNDLLDAYDFLSLIRIKHQANKINKELTPDNYINPSELSSMERRHLKDAFELIRLYQDVLSSRYNQGRL